MSEINDAAVEAALAGVRQRLTWASMHWGADGVDADAWPHIVRAALTAARAGEAIHLSDPDQGSSYCGEPVTVIDAPGDTRPICQTCHRGIAKRLRRMVDEYRNEAVDLRATVSPAWDEDAVLEAIVAKVPSPRVDPNVPSWPEDERDYFRNGGWGDFAERFETLDLVRRQKVARAVLAVVRDHQPVKSSRDEVARTLVPTLDEWWCGDHVDYHATDDEGGALPCCVVERQRQAQRQADAILTLLPGRTEAEVKAEAADEIERHSRRTDS